MKSIRFFINRRSSGDNPIWLTIYSDLMTNLMLFFLLMYGMTIMSDEMRQQIIYGLETKFKPKMTETRLKQVVDRIQEEESINRMNHYMISENLKRYAKVEVDEHKIRIILRTPILFESGKAEIKSQGRQVLSELAEVLQVLNKPIIVEGHTDDSPVASGAYESNRELSLERSMEVLRFFQAKGMDPSKLSASGYGEWRPLYPNDTELGRMLNRRVEIQVVREVTR
ncbi:MAG: flagellar motor protein MotB [bacterium]